jgi:D-alanyl-lipoteichoic acid acyltransferase DltB (MBOAT superfamily)
MQFQSFDFLLFFIVVLIVYFITAVRYRWIWLLAASYFFYSYWNTYYLILIVISTLTDYLVAIQLEKSNNYRKRWMSISVIINIGLLSIFKYFDFFSAQIETIGQQFDSTFHTIYLDLLLPLGISFYTFQTLGYTIDVYRGKRKAEKHLGKFALYVSFFPQLIAGPIERAEFLLPQFHFNYKFDYSRVVNGLRLILWGLFKKLVIADWIGLYVHQVFDFPEQHNGPIIWIASSLFFIQVYYDFSAYQDIAVGTAKILGIKLSDNFVNRAYYSYSFTQFWQGWHITLTRWVRDYIYFPLGGSHKGNLKTYINIFIIMTLIGVWHGAGWTFIIWGVLNGVFVVVERYLKDSNIKPNFPKHIGIIRFFQFLLFFISYSFTLIFFRSANIQDSISLLIQSFDFSNIYVQLSNIFIDFYLILFIIIVLDLLMIHMKEKSFDIYLNQYPTIVRCGVYIFFISSILFLRIPEEAQFIYFEF